jgi:hypothetical protein
MVSINQGLWTSSLVLFMGGVALLFLATCYFIVDVKKVTWWTTPFLIFGVNSIAVWVPSQLGMKTMMAINTSAADGSEIDLVWYHDEDWFTLASLDEDLTVEDLQKEFGLTPLDDYRIRAAQAVEAARTRAAGDIQ